MPAIPISTLQSIVPPEKAQEIVNTVFGPQPAEPTPAQQAEAEYTSSFQDMLRSKRAVLEQQRTDDVRMARFNALGNVLTSMVQPLGWAVGGTTAGVQPYDNRQYLDAFNRAVKATGDLRNLGSMEDEFKFQLAGDKYKRAQAMADYEAKAKYQADLNDAYAQAQHERRMEEIAARGDVQMQVAQIKAARVTTKDGKPVTGDNLKTAYTQWYRYLGRYWDDMGRGVPRKETNGPLSLAEFLRTPEGGSYNVDESSSSSTPATSTTATPTGNTSSGGSGGKKGGFQTGASTEKKGGFQK